MTVDGGIFPHPRWVIGVGRNQGEPHEWTQTCDTFEPPCRDLRPEDVSVGRNEPVRWSRPQEVLDQAEAIIPRRMAPNPDSRWGPYHHQEHDASPHSCWGDTQGGPACLTVEQRASLDRGIADAEAGRSRSLGSFAQYADLPWDATLGSYNPTTMTFDPAVSPEAWARAVIDSLPPKTWDVSIWQPVGSRVGRIDPADVLRIVAAVLDVAMETRLPALGGRAVPGVYTEEQAR